MTRRAWGDLARSHEGRAIVEGENAWAIVAGLVLAVVLLRFADWIAAAVAR